MRLDLVSVLFRRRRHLLDHVADQLIEVLARELAREPAPAQRTAPVPLRKLLIRGEQHLGAISLGENLEAIFQGRDRRHDVPLENKLPIDANAPSALLEPLLLRPQRLELPCGILDAGLEGLHGDVPLARLVRSLRRLLLGPLEVVIPKLEDFVSAGNALPKTRDLLAFLVQEGLEGGFLLLERALVRLQPQRPLLLLLRLCEEVLLAFLFEVQLLLLEHQLLQLPLDLLRLAAGCKVRELHLRLLLLGHCLLERDSPAASALKLLHFLL
mmetsp:Transcript_34772/g.82595  ORF Transcript_34772/g.82595 Transcript_34772/m.82595 type:complete len:270 (-) Transcript_34772:1429-2238(-)